MSLTKVQFGDKEVEAYTVTFNGEKWMVANPFAEALNYSVPHIAISKFVTVKNQKSFDEIKSKRSASTDCVTSLPRNIQAKTKFINRAGVFELINASDMPGAKRFQAWNNNDLLPALCQEGEYNMRRDAPKAIADGMNVVHAATNDGNVAPWYQQRDCDLHELVICIQKKDEIIAKCLEEIASHRIALEEKDRRVDALMHRVMDLSERAVEYPSKAHQQPILLLTQEGSTIRAVTGQKVHVDRKKRELLARDIVLECPRPNPQVDFNNIVDRVETTYAGRLRSRNRRRMTFDSEDTAAEVAIACKEMVGPGAKIVKLK
ncbi:hypothetical protein [Trichoplusia ni ascovirus 2c]|uniref:anti-repressor n=1 Tax=Trichoplusia ni ascovirus 2c TaxID=328615 RepID=UPI0000E44261|nr:anti-repressor [Trichoplusia ni ascovirus 2c]ABF70654.1 hypothetical protein [Trichoplusia ni ascovirus 2c]